MEGFGDVAVPMPDGRMAIGSPEREERISMYSSRLESGLDIWTGKKRPPEGVFCKWCGRWVEDTRGNRFYCSVACNVRFNKRKNKT